MITMMEAILESKRNGLERNKSILDNEGIQVQKLKEIKNNLLSSCIVKFKAKPYKWPSKYCLHFQIQNLKV